MSGMKRMTIQEAIDRIDMLKPNMFPVEQKKAWLSEVDKMVWHEIYLTHEGMPPEKKFDGYDQDTEPSTMLLVPEPYTDLYQHYMATMMDLANAESDKYMQDRSLFNAAYQVFGDFWRRTHMPIIRRRYIRF